MNEFGDFEVEKLGGMIDSDPDDAHGVVLEVIDVLTVVTHEKVSVVAFTGETALVVDADVFAAAVVVGALINVNTVSSHAQVVSNIANAGWASWCLYTFDTVFDKWPDTFRVAVFAFIGAVEAVFKAVADVRHF